MQSSFISVVIPVYNQAQFVSKTIQSVLNQTYQYFEVLVVNDASPDNASEIILSFKDPRIKLINHEENLGLPAARNTGVRASSGEIIALLDADDLFHPAKLQTHVDFLSRHPEIGVTYNSRFELHHSNTTIRTLWRPPGMVTLVDFVQGFPFSPSDMVLRRSWMDQVDMFDESFRSGGEDLDFPCRLAIAGCQFAGIDSALNYRRFHAGRRRKKLANRLDDYTRALERTFVDRRCPQEVFDLRNVAFSNHFLEVATYALSQDERELGQEILRKVIVLDPTWLSGSPSRLMMYFLEYCIMDETIHHQVVLDRIIKNLPEETQIIADEYNWALARGYLLRGFQAILWDQIENGIASINQVKDLRPAIDELFLQGLASQLVDIEHELGIEASERAMRNLKPYLEELGGRDEVRMLEGLYLSAAAFDCYRTGDYSAVPNKVFRALSKNPRYIRNRGVMAILVRSLNKGISLKFADK